MYNISNYDISLAQAPVRPCLPNWTQAQVPLSQVHSQTNGKNASIDPADIAPVLANLILIAAL